MLIYRIYLDSVILYLYVDFINSYISKSFVKKAPPSPVVKVFISIK